MYPKDENFMRTDIEAEGQLKDMIYNSCYRDLRTIVSEMGMDSVFEMLEDIMSDLEQDEDQIHMEHKWRERRIKLSEYRHKHWSGQ